MRVRERVTDKVEAANSVARNARSLVWPKHSCCSLNSRSVGGRTPAELTGWLAGCIHLSSTSNYSTPASARAYLRSGAGCAGSPVNSEHKLLCVVCPCLDLFVIPNQSAANQCERCTGWLPFQAGFGGAPADRLATKSAQDTIGWRAAKRA